MLTILYLLTFILHFITTSSQAPTDKCPTSHLVLSRSETHVYITHGVRHIFSAEIDTSTETIKYETICVFECSAQSFEKYETQFWRNFLECYEFSDSDFFIQESCESDGVLEAFGKRAVSRPCNDLLNTAVYIRQLILNGNVRKNNNLSNFHSGLTLLYQQDVQYSNGCNVPMDDPENKAADCCVVHSFCYDRGCTESDRHRCDSELLGCLDELSLGGRAQFVERVSVSLRDMGGGYFNTDCTMNQFSALEDDTTTKYRSSNLRLTPPLNFDDALVTCASLGGTLVSITSKTENDVVRDYCVSESEKEEGDRRCYTGFVDTGSTWLWIDSSLIHYTNWAEGEPDSSGSVAAIYEDGYWYDFDENDPLEGVCYVPSPRVQDTANSPSLNTDVVEDDEPLINAPDEDVANLDDSPVEDDRGPRVRNTREADFCDIEIIGVEGDNNILNGLYKYSERTYNDRPYYEKVGDQFVLYFESSNGRWYIADELGAFLVNAKAHQDVDTPELIDIQWLVIDDGVFIGSDMESRCFECASHAACQDFGFEYCADSGLCQNGCCTYSDPINGQCPNECNGLALGSCVGDYCMSYSGQSCTESCASFGRTCGKIYPQVSLDTFLLFGDCPSEDFVAYWWSCEQPAYVTNPENTFHLQCAGYTGIPEEGVDCDCKSPNVARLCYCVVSISDATALWFDCGISCYTYDLTVTNPHGIFHQTKVEVYDGGYRYVDIDSTPNNFPTDPRIASIFDNLDSEIDRGTSILAEYDDVCGYPTSVVLDYYRGVSDDEVLWSISNLEEVSCESLEPEILCEELSCSECLRHSDEPSSCSWQPNSGAEGLCTRNCEESGTCYTNPVLEEVACAAEPDIEPWTAQCFSEYCIGAPGESCDDICGSRGKICNRSPNESDVSVIMSEFGDCDQLSSTNDWSSCEQPAFVSGQDSRNAGLCIGVSSLPNEIDCSCADADVQRFCMCVDEPEPTSPPTTDPPSPPKEEFHPPHILLIVVDDLGFHDVGFNGAEYRTVTIDEFAESATILQNYYVQPLCTPSRAALMTGRAPLEIGAQNFVFYPMGNHSISLQNVVLSERLQYMNYKTHMVGKWHLGYPSIDTTPCARGFDSFFGMFQNRFEHFSHDLAQWGVDTKCGDDEYDDEDFLPYGYDLFDQDCNSVGSEYHGQYSTHIFTDKLIEQIRLHHDQENTNPMFLFAAYTAVHDPWQCPYKYFTHPECKNLVSNERRVYCGMMQTVDEGIKNITDVMKEYGYLENTIIVFSSDNGATVVDTPYYYGTVPPAGSNYPLRSGKGQNFEGGQKSASFIWGNPLRSGTYVPGTNRYQAGTATEALFHVSDWFLTLAAAASAPGVPVEMEFKTKEVRGKAIGASFNMWPYLKDMDNAEPPRREMLYNVAWPIDELKGAIRNEHYKLYLRPHLVGHDGWFNAASDEEDEITCSDDTIDCEEVLPEQLFFRISDDMEERHPLDIDNLNDEEQTNYDELVQLFDDWAEISMAALVPGESERIYDANGLPRFHDCHWRPWISTDKHPISFDMDCFDGDPQINCAEELLYPTTVDDWKQYAGWPEDMSGIFEMDGEGCPDGCTACVIEVELVETDDRVYSMEIHINVDTVDTKMVIVDSYSGLLENDAQIQHSKFSMEKSGDTITFRPLVQIAGFELCETILIFNDRTFTVEWSQRTSLKLEPYEEIFAEVGYKIHFDWIKSHDLYMFKDEEHYENCDFEDATELSIVSPYNFHLTDEHDGKTLYFGCNIEEHCRMDQKIVVHVTGIPEDTPTIISTLDWRMSSTGTPDDKYPQQFIYEGEAVQFTWRSDHDVMQFLDYDHYENCDFTDATELASESDGEYIFIAGRRDVGNTLYFGCSYANGVHCKFTNQKIEITVLADGQERPVTGLEPIDTPDSGDSGNTGTTDGETITIMWRLTMSVDEFDVNAGDVLQFSTSGNLNIQKFEDEEHFNNCDFSGAELLTSNPLTYTTSSTESGEALYFGCSVGDLCVTNDLKITVRVAAI